MKTPLAWLNLTHDYRRLLPAVGGIGFAVLLMFMQLGFRGALFDSTLALPRRFQADLVLVNPQRYTLSVYAKFPRRYLELIRTSPTVATAEPFYFENIRSYWKPADKPTGPPIRVVACNPRRGALDIPEIAEFAAALEQPGNVIFDRKSKGDFRDTQIGDVVEINGRRVRVVGEFSLGTDFADDGTVISGERTFNNLFFSHLPGDEGLSQIDMGLVRLGPGVDLAAARDELDALLPEDVVVFTKQQYLDFELGFWNSATPIGYVFMLGTSMGFIVGTIICYQILFSDIVDHIREFATLKAMGYRPAFFIGVVLQEAILLSLFGFGPGLVAAQLLYATISPLTGLVMDLSMSRIWLVLGLTMTMCIISGLLTMTKVLTTDPAELF